MSKPLLTALAAACALSVPALAQARQVTLTTQLKNYGGDGAYLAVYLTDAKGAYAGTLWVAGGKAKYYKHLSDWNRLSAGDTKRLVGVTGVSGSGKSTLIQDILHPALLRHFGLATDSPGEHDDLLGADWLSAVNFVDQSPIGKTARSNPASYVGAFDAVRTLSKAIGIPQRLGEIGIKEEQLPQLAADALIDPCTGGNPKDVTVEDILAIYKKAL